MVGANACYIKENIDFTEEYLKEHIPGIGMIRPASFLSRFSGLSSFGADTERINPTFCRESTSGSE